MKKFSEKVSNDKICNCTAIPCTLLIGYHLVPRYTESLAVTPQISHGGTAKKIVRPPNFARRFCQCQQRTVQSRTDSKYIVDVDRTSRRKWPITHALWNYVFSHTNKCKYEIVCLVYLWHKIHVESYKTRHQSNSCTYLHQILTGF